MLALINVAKSFGGLPVLHSTTLRLEPGKTTVLIGPSGCGKSTVLRLMVGLIPPDQGQVLFYGQPLTRGNVMLARQRIGYVIQDGGLFPHLSAEGNVSLLARYLGWDRQRVRQRIHELADLTRLPREVLNRYPAQLSGGQKQRLAIMRALMLEPQVILLDEPMGALDPLVRYELQEDLRKIFVSLGKTVAMVTHDMAEAGFFADTVVLMGGGRIVQQGTLDDLLQRPADDFVQRFICAQRLPAVAGGRNQP